MGRAPARPSRRLMKSPWKAGEYLSLDFEATGPDLQHDRIVSLGAVPIRAGRVEVGEARYQLVDPGDRINEHGAVWLHGIRPVDLVGAPSQEVAKTALSDSLDHRILVAWHAGIEAGFLARLFGVPARTWLRRTLDVRDLLVELEGEPVARLSLTEAAVRHGVPVSDPHHALDDAVVTAQLFLILATGLERRDGRMSVGDLLNARPMPPPVLRRPRAPL
jgi:DNA polymerase-3 subunit epsilon